MTVMTTMVVMALRIRRNHQPSQNDKCDDTEKHSADLHIPSFFTACFFSDGLPL
jgi:hypothetical protein